MPLDPQKLSTIKNPLYGRVGWAVEDKAIQESNDVKPKFGTWYQQSGMMNATLVCTCPGLQVLWMILWRKCSKLAAKSSLPAALTLT
mmetsp:Transcript_4023/g.7161  ORF Transcript_4023/g.7161 Transcript_4023/m.7161 type:complete len:87 (-) Transcript_4023:299-559(-)